MESVGSGAGGDSGDEAFGDADFGDGDLFGARLFSALDKRDPAPGTVLVSAPDMPDPRFRRVIVYMVEHDFGGSLVVVLTRRSETAVAGVLPAWAPLCSPPDAFHIGGPVKPDTGIALAVLSPGVDGETFPFLQRVEGRVHAVDLDGDPEQLEDSIDGLRLFVGYTGWAPGQLQAELDHGDWYVAAGLPSDLLAPARVDIWGEVLRRQEMPLPLYATYVADDTLN